MEIREPGTVPAVIDDNESSVGETELFDPAQGELEELRKELAAEREERLRLAAEFQNYRRRTSSERAIAADEGKRETLMQMLSIADDLELALSSSGDASDPVREGLAMIHRRVSQMLERNGAVRFESVGLEFDPTLHEAFDVVSGIEGKEGIVHSEVRPGYMLNGKLLRPALVVVCQ